MFDASQYQLLDFGQGRKLERFGSLVLDRVSPAADGDLPADPASWQNSHFRFQHQQGEQGQGVVSGLVRHAERLPHSGWEHETSTGLSLVSAVRWTAPVIQR